MGDRTEVWERRPGGRWEVVHCGTREAAHAFVQRCTKRRRGARFTVPVEQVVLPLGEYPTRDAAPTAVIA